jgi:hypothetical protein
MHQEKFACFSYKLWWILFFCLQAFVIVIMVGTLTTPRWVHSENSLWQNTDTTNGYRGYIGYYFEGSLTSCTDNKGCVDSYGQNAQDWCNFYNEQHGLYGDSDYVKTVLSICLQFATLYYGSGIFLLAELIAIVSIIIWAVMNLLIWRQRNCFCMSFCCSACLWVAHYIGTIIFLGLTNTNFNGKCSDTPTNGNRPMLCANDGPGLALFNLLFIPVLVVGFCIVGCRVQRVNAFGTLNFHSPVPAPAAVIIQPPPYTQQPLPGFAQPGYAQPGYAQPGYAQPGIVYGYQGYPPGSGPPQYVPNNPPYYQGGNVGGEPNYAVPPPKQP